MTEFFYEKDEQGNYYLTCDRWAEHSDTDLFTVKIEDREFPVFRQSGYCYGDYSEYMKRHGCACCSLTTVLSSMKKEFRELTPDQTITKIERTVFGKEVWKKNYSRAMVRQMPVSLYGISQILSHYGIEHHYIREFRYKESVEQIRTHLLKKKPVIVETRRIKKCEHRIMAVNDKKYAGSYHTMVLLGINKEGDVIFTDSAFRMWSGSSQRLKKASLYDMAYYMFAVKDPSDTHVYFHRRKGTGGFILL